MNLESPVFTSFTDRARACPTVRTCVVAFPRKNFFPVLSRSEDFLLERSVMEGSIVVIPSKSLEKLACGKNRKPISIFLK